MTGITQSASEVWGPERNASERMRRFDEEALFAPATGGRRPATLADLERELLCRAVETEIIPRLVAAHRARSPSPMPRSLTAAPQECAAIYTAADAVAFAELALAAQVDEMERRIDAAHRRGVPLESLCEQLLAPAARWLGTRWGNDDSDFVEVTLALWLIQKAWREQAPRFTSVQRNISRDLRALLIVVPGEEHTLGLSMVQEYFLRAGWLVDGESPVDVAGIARSVAGNWYDVIGLSVSCDVAVASTAASIRAVRRSSCNANVVVMVGGPLFDGQEQLAAQLGADLAVTRGTAAPALAEELVRQKAELQAGIAG